jgi:signal transduction histidine kinase
MSFGVSDKEIAVTIEKMEGGKSIQSLLMSNDPPYVKHFTSMFEELWRNGIDASDSIREIEVGIEEANIEVIHNPSLALDRYLDTVSSAKQNIFLIFPTTNAFIRHQRTGVFYLLREIVQLQKVKVRILMPYHELTVQTIESLKKNAEKDVDIRSIKQAENAMATFLVVDKKLSLVMEIRDDSKETFDESIGLSVYSTSKAGVLSYVSMFESLWSQNELYERLKVHDRMQREFINIASHEIRTPTQAVLGFSQLLEQNPKNKDEIIHALRRNADRLQRLSNDILDVTRIESQTLKLIKEKVDINEIILNVINDVGNQIRNPNKLNISFSQLKDPIYVEADKLRLCQVLVNLLSNAIKFTREGTISIKTDMINNNNGELVISITDEGTGIDPAIMSRLFTKFATRSNVGTGLGLYISRNIIESHGGKVWAENNMDRKGATFSFSLPIIQ